MNVVPIRQLYKCHLMAGIDGREPTGQLATTATPSAEAPAPQARQPDNNSSANSVACSCVIVSSWAGTDDPPGDHRPADPAGTGAPRLDR
jgi:hypothetical protein